MKRIIALLLVVLMLSATVQFMAFSEEKGSPVAASADLPGEEESAEASLTDEEESAEFPPMDEETEEGADESFSPDEADEEGNCTIVFVDLPDEEDLDGQDLEEVAEEGYVPEDAEKAIFGRDNRITVNNPRAYPFCTIAYMEVTGSCGHSWTGTGFMVGKNRLLTAAHCVMCPTHSRWARYVNFYFGYKSAKNYYYKYTGRFTMTVGNSFRRGGYETRGDFACIQFDSSVGDRTGWLGSMYGMRDKDLLSKTIYVAGYRDKLLKYDYGKLKSVDSEFLRHNIDMVAGNSGGPVFFRDKYDRYYAVGINIAENRRENIGYRLSRTIFNCFR